MHVNNKGFTLIELIATLIILALVMSIGAYSVINVINAAKRENYNLLIKNIKDAAQAYYQECRYGDITCNSDGNTSLGNLVNYGFLKGNSTDNDNFKLINPNTEESISECVIKITSDNGVINVIAVDPTGSCPTSY